MGPQGGGPEGRALFQTPVIGLHQEANPSFLPPAPSRALLASQNARQWLSTPAGPAVPRAARLGRLLLRTAYRRIALHPNQLGRPATRALLTQTRSARTPEQTCGATIVAAAIRPASVASILASTSALPAASAAFDAFDASPTFASAV